MLLKVDPQLLERLVLTGTALPPRRRIPQKTIRLLSILRRSLQALPPRECMFLYLVHVKRITQQEVSTLYPINQQNVSHRINQASERICLHYRIINLSSETQLRRTMFSLGFDAENVRAVTGLVRTTSQIATAEALGDSPGRIRYWYKRAITKLEKFLPESAELQLLRLIGRNLYGLSCIDPQQRWGKKKDGDRPRRTATRPEMRLEELFHAAL